METRAHMIDVAIAGGGIAGASLAVALGRAGYSVALFERDRFPREKPCGEGIMPAGVAALERLGLREAVGGQPFLGVRYIDGRRVAEARFPSDGGLPATGLGQRRLRLDRTLFGAAAATPGVVAHEGSRVEAPAWQGGRVCGLIVNGKRRPARLVVIADGLHSPLRRTLGLDGPPPRRVRTGIRVHYRLAPEQPREPWVEVYLGRGHELYVTPLPDGEVLVAALVERNAIQGGVEVSFARWLAAQPRLAARLRRAERLTAYLGRSPLAHSARPGVLPGAVLLGDAAGYVDPITGGGIAQALLSSELLASHVPAILANGDGWLLHFDRERRAMLREYQLLTRFVLALSAHRPLTIAMLQLLRTAPPLFTHLVGVAGGTRRLLPGVPGRPARRVSTEGRGRVAGA